jgi:hypothetical protein
MIEQMFKKNLQHVSKETGCFIHGVKFKTSKECVAIQKNNTKLNHNYWFKYFGVLLKPYWPSKSTGELEPLYTHGELLDWIDSIEPMTQQEMEDYYSGKQLEMALRYLPFHLISNKD